MAFAITMTFATSCNNEAPDVSSEIKVVKTEKRKTVKLKKDVVELSSSDASIVANLVKGDNKLTRSLTDNEIIGTVTINDSEGNPSIYAVNFTDGYMLISATKKYYPVLAVIDHGTFSMDEAPDGEKFLINGMLANISANRVSTPDSTATRIAREWLRYEESTRPARTRGDVNSPTEEEYQEALEVFIGENIDQSEGIYKLTENPDLFPEDVYERYCRRAEGERDDLFGGTKYSWYHTAMIKIVEHNDVTLYGPYLTTQWDQYFTDSMYAPILGCTTVATGQLMRYFRYPASFDWDAMPDKSNTSTTASFLKKLRAELNTTVDNTSTFADAERVLTSYGYSCSRISHNYNLVAGSLKKKNPVLQRGNVSGATVGHAWICDGYDSRKTWLEYELYGLGYSNYTGELIYEEYSGKNYEVWINTGTTYFHMNWGWGGIHDGWYLEDLSDMPSGMQYNQNRQDIIINGHN